MSRLLEILLWGSLICLCSFWAGCDDDSCVDVDAPCDAQGEERCAPDGSAVEECSVGENGCLSWSVRRSCSGAMTCVDDGDRPRCECIDDCDRPGQSECNEDIARFCRENNEGCRYWFETNCGLMDQSCVMSSGIAECVADCESNCFRRDATRCGSEVEIETCSDVADGCLRWEVTETCSEPSQSCDDSGESAACVEVCVSECEEVEATRCSEEGDIESCVDPGNACLAWELTLDCGEEQLCEERLGALGCFDEHDCGDGLDDDGDGSTDCDDDECFGVAPTCLVETNCRDSADNDLDLLVDCDDDDCAEGTACVPMGIWELFHVLDENDLEGCTVVFTPEDTAPSRFTVSSTCACTADWLETPGSGDASTVVALDDDDSQEVILTVTPRVTFYNRYWSSIFVGSNGFVTLGESDVGSSSSTDEFFSTPRIAPLDTDLDPSVSGTVTVDEWGDRVAVSYDGVAFVDTPGATASFQLVIEASGTISMVVLALGSAGEGFVGVSNGVETGVYPEQLDFMTRVQSPAQPGEVIFTELHFNAAAVDDEQGEFMELYNATDADIDVACCVLSDGDGAHEIGPLVISVGGVAVLARSDDPATNGGIEGASAYGDDLDLDDVMSEVLTLQCDDVIIDELDFRGGAWPAGGPGTSVQLSSLTLQGALNDDPALWCASTDTYGDGDLGSPGETNGDCDPLIHVTEDCEVDPGWSMTGDWEWGSPDARFLDGPNACAQGTGCFGTDMYGDYTNDHAGTSNALIVGPIDLSGLTTAYLRFDMWLDIEPDADGLRVVVADGVTTTIAYPVSVPFYNAPAGAPSMWSGDFGDEWFTVVMDLAPIVGETSAYIFWQFDADSADTAAGAYVDTIELVGF